MSQPVSGPGWLEGLGFAIIDQPGGGGASGGGAAPSGQGFAMSADEARGMLTIAKRLRDKYQGMLDTAQSLTKLTSPADEPGSNGYNKLLVDTGPPPGTFVAGADQVKQEYAYADELVTRLEQALGITEASDEQAGTDVKNATSDNEGKGFAG